IPIFHVNSEDPEAVLRVARMAVEDRYQFGRDVVIDLIGHPRPGHSGGGDPTLTQPLLSQQIKSHSPPHAISVHKNKIDTSEMVAQYRAQVDAAYDNAGKMEKSPLLRKLPAYWDSYTGGRYNRSYEVPTNVSEDRLRELTARLVSYPQDFAIHPK